MRVDLILVLNGLSFYAPIALTVLFVQNGLLLWHLAFSTSLCSLLPESHVPPCWLFKRSFLAEAVM